MSAFLDDLRAETWAMEPQRLSALAALAHKAGALEHGDLEAAIAASRHRDDEDDDDDDLWVQSGSTAIVPVSGVLVRKAPSWFAWMDVDATETPKVARAVQAAVADPGVERIVLLVSSPGGQAQGIDEVADAIRAATKEKPVDCVIDTLCASGAYWLASQASSIAANKDAYVGSIGVYRVLVDSSAAAERAGFKVHVVRTGEHKGMGIGGAPITDAQLAAEQELVDGLARMFEKAVKTGRDLKDTASLATGQVWLARTAKAKGLVDTVEPVTSALSRLAPQDTEDQMRGKTAKAIAALAAIGTIPNQQNEELVEKARAEDRARLTELKGAFPEDKDFAFEQYEAGATVEEAKAAYADVLAERLEEERAAKAEVLTQLEQEKAKKKTLPAGPEAGKPVPFGGTPEAEKPAQDFVSQARAYAKEHGCKVREAMSAIAAQDPQGHFEWKESIPLVRRNDRGYTRSPDKVAK